MLLAIVGVAIAAAVAIWLMRRGAAPSAPSAPAAREPKTTGRFGAVEIRVRSAACAAARALEGQRFLSADAPALPLPTCNVAKCSCSFGKLSDRRTEGRRLEHGGLSASLFLSNNRRTHRDRRRAKKSR